jgi:uncharacterized protein
MLLTMRIVYLIFRFIVILDYYIEKTTKTFILKSKYKVSGKCQKCGVCCKLIGAKISDFITHRKWLIFLIVKYYEKINDFSFHSFLEQENMLLFTCNNFNEKGSKCLSYKIRPAICRGYPLVRYFQKPVLLQECHFKAELR